MQDEAPYRPDDVDAEFEQALTQECHLRAGTGGACGSQPQFLHEHVGRRGEEHAQLIGPETTAAGAPKLKPVVEFFDPILNVAARAVDALIEKAGRLPQIRDDEARSCCWQAAMSKSK